MATIVGLLHLDFRVPGAASLKDKRQAVKSFKDRTAHAWNVSVAEVSAQDNHHRAVLAVAMVGSDRQYVEGALQKIVNGADRNRDMILIDTQIDWM